MSAKPELSVISTRLAAPPSEFSPEFVHQMANRMAVSFHKYGAVDANYPRKFDAVTEARRIDLYEQTRNTEWLVDAANFAMIEHMRPSAAGAHFRATDSDESPGPTERTPCPGRRNGGGK